MSSWRASQLLGQTVQNTSSGGATDKLLHLLINADTGAILALIGREAITRPDKISSAPPRLWGRPVSADEKENINLALKNRLFVLKCRVETESGHYLGKVFDFEFDDISWKIQRIFISDRILFRALSAQLQIPREDILFIGRDKVIVRDGLVKRESVARAAQPSAEYVSVGNGAALLGK